MTSTDTNPLPHRNRNRRSAYMYKYCLKLYIVVLLFLFAAGATATATDASDNSLNDIGNANAKENANMDNLRVHVDMNINMDGSMDMDFSDIDIASPTLGFEQLISETDQISLSRRHLEEEAEEINDDIVNTLMGNPNFAECNNDTTLFYQQNRERIYDTVLEFGRSATQTWGNPELGQNPLDLLLEFNATTKEAMRLACLNVSGLFAFAGDINCKYRIQQVPPKEYNATLLDPDGDATQPPSLELKNFTVYTNITNFANCVANTQACQNVSEDENNPFLQIIMHSLGSACDGFQRDDPILQTASGHTRTAFGALATAWVLALVVLS